MDVPEILSLEAFPNRCKNERFGGRYGHFFVFRGVGSAKVQMYGNVGLNTFSFTDSKCLLKGIFGPQPASRSKMSWNPKVWMASQTIAKTYSLVIVLDILLCFVVVGGTQRFKCTEM